MLVMCEEGFGKCDETWRSYSWNEEHDILYKFTLGKIEIIYIQN